jgi:hypothetical protein
MQRFTVNLNHVSLGEPERLFRFSEVVLPEELGPIEIAEKADSVVLLVYPSISSVSITTNWESTTSQDPVEIFGRIDHVSNTR